MATAKAQSVAVSASPPPEFSDTRAAGGSCTVCGRAPGNDKPCDLGLVKISDAAGNTAVSTGTTKRLEQAATLPKDKRAFADSYAMVLEVVSPVKTTGQKFDATKVPKLKAAASFANGPCGHHRPKPITAKPTNFEPSDPIQNLTGYEPGQMNLSLVGHAHPMDNPSGVQRGLLQFASFFDWSERYVKVLEVQFRSCGMRKPNPPAALGVVTGLVRVYRDDIYVFTLKGPAIGRRNVLSNTRWGTYSSSSRTAPGAERTTSFAGGTKAAPTTTTLVSTPNRVTGQSNLSMSTKPTELDNDWVASLTRNGVPLELVEMFQSLVKRLVETANKAIRLIEEIKEAIPKIGVWIECQISFMETEVSLEWGRRRAPAEWNNGRYQWIEEYLDGTFKITFVTFKWTLKAGLEASSSSIVDWFIKRKAFELKLVFVVDVTVTVAAEGRLNLSGSDLPKEKGEIEPVSTSGKIVVKVGGEIKVNVFGVAIVDGAIGVKLTASIDAKVKIPFDVQIEGVWGNTVGYCKFASGSHISPEIEQELLPGFTWPDKWRWLRPARLSHGASGSR